MPHLPLFAPIIIAVVVGLLVGLLNGFIMAKFSVPPFIATLGTGYFGPSGPYSVPYIVVIAIVGINVSRNLMYTYEAAGVLV